MSKVVTVSVSLWVLVILLFLSSSAAHANLINNPSFEAFTGSFGPDGDAPLPPGANTLTNWTIVRGEIAVIATPNSARVVAYCGSNFLDLAGFTNSGFPKGISQAVGGLTIGQTYTFAMHVGITNGTCSPSEPCCRAGAWICDGPVEVKATIGSVSQTFTHDSAQPGTVWSRYGFDFTAAAATMILTIEGSRLPPGNVFIGLDSVSVVAQGSDVCGDGVVGISEQCDDCTTTDGDCCSSTCQFPSGCKGSGKSLLLLKNNASDDTKDKLVWKWLKGAETMFDDLGDPTSTTNYTLCLYAGTASATLGLPAGSNWQAAGTKGYKFKDKSGTPDGAQKALLKSGDAGKAKALVKGKGTNLPDTLVPELPLPVTVQLVNNTNSTCFEATYNTAIKNDAKQFKAKTP